MLHGFKYIVPIVALAATGCNAIIVEDLTGPRFSYFDGDFEFAANKGSVLTDVSGNPFNMDPKQFGALVRSAMRNQIDLAINTNFVAGSDGTTVPPYRVVVAFNPPSHISNHDLCAQRGSTPSGPASGKVEVRMAFCYGDSLKSGSAAWVNGLSSANEPRFGQLVRQATRALVPAQDNEETGEGGRPL